MTVVRWLPRFRAADRLIRELKDRETWPRAQVEAFQLDRLNQVWARAIADVPYYRALAAERRLPGSFDSIAEFTAAVPVLPRTIVKERPRELLSNSPDAGSWKYSSGSTGRPISAFWSSIAHRESLAAKYRFYASYGVDVFDRTVFLWGGGSSLKPGLVAWAMRQRQPCIDRLRNRLRLSALHLSRENLRQYLRAIQAFRPAMIYGYSRALYLLAAEAEAMGGFRCDSLKVIVASAEPAWPHMIQRIARAMNVPVAREYGAQECGIIATDAPDGTLRTRDDQVLVETRDAGDGQYDLLITVLTNPSFPLIRYAVGDRTDRPIEYPEIGFATLGSIAGRNYDFLRSKRGEYVHWVHIENAISGFAQQTIRRFRIHQRADGAVHVQIEPDERASPETRKTQLAGFERFLRERLEGYPVFLHIVDQVEQTAAGKHLVVVSDLYDLGQGDALKERETPSPA
jgi:phenylacetate-CoA ligase